MGRSTRTDTFSVGIGAVFYVEHAKHLFPKPGSGDQEENELLAAIDPGKC